MLLVQEDGDGILNVILDGYLSTGYKTERKDGIVSTIVTVCYNIIYDRFTREKTYRNAVITAYEEENARMIAAVKRDKRGRIIVLGTTDKNPSEYIKLGSLPRIRATAILPITEFLKMRYYSLGAMRYDESITKAYETRYDYVTPENESDHMI